MNKKLRPIIKWTGGKYDEFPLFASHIPSFKRYVEPFFGGGGVFFALQPKVPAFLNDKSDDLIHFYQQIAQEEFKVAMFQYEQAWQELGEMHELMWKACGKEFVGFVLNEIEGVRLKKVLEKHFAIALTKQVRLNDLNFILDLERFKLMLLASLFNKARRINGISKRENRVFTMQELMSHFETGIRGGAYLFFRKILNLYVKEAMMLSQAKAVANWYFVREYCYGSMFRFNAKGEFNIPYGGIAYNRKNFSKKLSHIFNPAVLQLFKQAKLFNLDFEEFLSRIDLQAEDFIFVDPPYDSEFSEYDQNTFTKSDQKRLASFLIKTKARWMMVIKETQFIRDLYTQESIKIIDFDKKYSYNVRGRNNRTTMHLIITNY